MQVHVAKDGHEAKFQLQPEVVLAYNHGFNARALADLARVVEGRRTGIEEAWHDHFG